MTPEEVERRDNQLYCEKQVADWLGVKPATLRKWRMGYGDTELPFVKVGKSVRYRHADIVAFIEGRTHIFTSTI